MKLSDLLDAPAAVRVPLVATDKQQVIAELVELLESSHDVHSSGDVLHRVLEREQLMSTGIGQGVAIPHAKSPSVDEVIAACGVAPPGLDYGTTDQEPVRLVILVVSPDQVRAAHMQALAAISRLVQREDVRCALIEAVDPQTFFERLLAAEEHDA